MFQKKILITGGKGTFGNAVLQSFLDTGIKEIRIFSCDEKKQDDMRKKYADSKLKFYIEEIWGHHTYFLTCRESIVVGQAVEMKGGDKKIRRFENIVGWQKARKFVKVIYQMTNESEKFRKDFGLKDQIRRVAASSMSNISEGFARSSDK